MDELKLKPCPFCGNLPQTHVEVTGMGGENDKVSFSIVCKECGTNKKVTLYTSVYKTFADVQEAIDLVIEIWNKRITDD